MRAGVVEQSLFQINYQVSFLKNDWLMKMPRLTTFKINYQVTTTVKPEPLYVLLWGKLVRKLVALFNQS